MEKPSPQYLPTDPEQLQGALLSDEYLQLLYRDVNGDMEEYLVSVEGVLAAAQAFHEPTIENFDHWRYQQNRLTLLQLQSRKQQSPPSEG